jgi:hypothetical protein
LRLRQGNEPANVDAASRSGDFQIAVLRRRRFLLAEASAVCKPPLIVIEWWLAPIVVLLLTLGLNLVLTEGSAVAAFIYSLFYSRRILFSKYS